MSLFDDQTSRTPSLIGSLRLVVDVEIASDGTRSYAGTCSYKVIDQNGEEIDSPIGNPAPELTQQQIDAQIAVVDTLVDKAEATLP